MGVPELKDLRKKTQTIAQKVRREKNAEKEIEIIKDLRKLENAPKGRRDANNKKEIVKKLRKLENAPKGRRDANEEIEIIKKPKQKQRSGSRGNKGRGTRR